MSMEAVLTLVLGATSLVLLQVALRNIGFWSQIGALFVAAAVIFHGVSEVMASLSSEPGAYRLIATPALVNAWLLWAGPALLLFTVGYLAVRLPGARVAPAAPAQDDATVCFLDWRWCLLATLPVYLVAVQGEGFVPGSTVDQTNYVQGGVTDQFLLLGVVLTTFAVAMRTKRFLPAVVGQSVALMMLGQRGTVIGGMIMLCYLLARHGLRLTRQHVLILAVLGIMGSLTLSSARVAASRADFGSGSGPTERVGALIDGIGSLARGEAYSDLADDYVYRFDGNAFPSLVLDAQRAGDPAAGIAPAVVAVSLAVPSFLNPAKRSSAEWERDEKGYLVHYHSLTTRVDFLPTFMGSGLAVGGPFVLLLIAVVFGALTAMADRWLSHRSPARSIVAVSLVSCVVGYARGFQILPVTMRGAATLAGIVWLLQAVTNVVRHRERTASTGGKTAYVAAG